MDPQNRLWIVETGPQCRASDILRSAYGIQRRYGAESAIWVDRGLPAGEQSLLSQAVSRGRDCFLPQSLGEDAFERYALITVLPAGAVPLETGAATPNDEVIEGRALCVEVPEQLTALPANGIGSQRGLSSGNTTDNGFLIDLKLLSPRTVVTAAGAVLAPRGDNDTAFPGNGPSGPLLRTRMHASGLPIVHGRQRWADRHPAETREGAAAVEMPGRGSPARDMLPNLVNVLVPCTASEDAGYTATLDSLRASDLAECRIDTDPSRGLVRGGGRLFTLLLHPGHVVHPRTGEILLSVMDDAPVALLRALVDGSVSPVELWWTRTLRRALAQTELEIDLYARNYGDERWIAGSWAGIHNLGHDQRRIPKRFLERVG